MYSLLSIEFQIESADLLTAVNNNTLIEENILSFKECVNNLQEFVGYENYKSFFIIDTIIKYISIVLIREGDVFDEVIEKINMMLVTINNVIPFNIFLYKAYLSYWFYCINNSNKEDRIKSIAYLEESVNKITDIDSLSIKINIVRKLLIAYLFDPILYISKIPQLSEQLKILNSTKLQSDNFINDHLVINI